MIQEIVDGMANWTAPETPTPTRMASPPPAMLPPGPVSAPLDDLRQRHNWLHEQWNERNISAVLPYIEPEIHYVDQATGQVLTTAEELANHISRPLNASSDAKIANYEYFQSGDQTSPSLRYMARMISLMKRILPLETTSLSMQSKSLTGTAS